MAKKRQSVRRAAKQKVQRVFFVYDMTDMPVGMILRDLAEDPPEGYSMRVPGVTSASGDLWSNVEAEIRQADAVVGMVDKHNANVSFELGFALGIGKPVYLLASREHTPPWVNHPPLKGILRGSGSDVDKILTALEKPGVTLGEPPQPGDATLFFCPRDLVGGSIHRKWKSPAMGFARDYRRLPPEGWNLEDLAKQFSGCGRAVWTVLDFDSTSDQRDGEQNTVCGALAGLAFGLGLKLRIFRAKSARKVVDVERGERTFDTVKQYIQLLEVVDSEDRQAAATPAEAGSTSSKQTPVQACWATYRRWVKTQHQTIVPFFGLAIRTLQEVYVERRVELLSGKQDHGLGEDALRSGLNTLASLLAAGASRPDPGKPAKPKKGSVKGGRSTTKGGRTAAALVLLGEPGAGKTTTLRQLAWDMADNSAGPLPLFLSLARWANAPAAEDPISLLAADCAGSGSGVDAGVLRAALQAAKDKEGPGLVLLLDGLDEVDNSAKSKLLERVLGRIRQLLHEWPETALVVSSRLTGYPGRPAEDFVECRLSPLDQGRQRDLLAHWLGADLANRALARIAERVRLAELAGNPLLLTLLAKLFQGAPEKALPATRGQLYQAAIKVLLEQGHGIDRTGMEQPISARDILRPLAWRLLAAGGAAWSEELINRILRKEVKADEDLLLNLRLNFGGSEAFLTQVRQRGGVLGDHDGAGQPWRFLHRSLGEQLAAEAMAATNAWNPATLLPDLAEEGGLDRWGETISLLTGLLKQDDPRRAELLQAIARHSHDLATRLLPQLEGLGIEEAWTLLEQVPKEEYDPYPWDGVDLAALLRSLAADGHPIDVLEASLLKRAKPLLARAKKSNRGEYLERAAHLLFALEQLQLLHAVEPRPSPLHRPAAVQAATQRFFEALGIQPPEPEWIPRAIRVPAKGPTVTFAMGSQDGVGQDDEHPLRPEVVLSAFALGITPVTEAQFRRLEGTPPPKGKENHPVTGVSWWQAWLYCRWVGGQLPSEAHWECAARAGTDTLWPTGNTPEDLEKQAWFDGGKGKGADQTHPVAKLQANPWGFHDLLGNVWEWCADFYGPYDPAKREDPAGPPSGAHRVLRGGSAWNDAARCRPGQRVRYWPWDRNVNGGFRVAFPCS